MVALIPALDFLTILIQFQVKHNRSRLFFNSAKNVTLEYCNLFRKILFGSYWGPCKRGWPELFRGQAPNDRIYTYVYLLSNNVRQFNNVGLYVLEWTCAGANVVNHKL